MNKALITILCAALAGCAESPSSINPAYISNSTYMNMSCVQLGDAENTEGDKLATLSGKQRRAHKTDFWGVMVTGVPLSELTGSDVPELLAREKGKIEAIHRVENIKQCAQ